MKVPSVQVNETARLQLLEKLDLLASPPDDAFDRVVRLTAIALRVPIAAVTVVDSTHQWFKSKVGMTLKQTHRADSLCQYAMQAQDMLVIEDARSDPRFAHTALVSGPPYIRFYVGVPLRSAAGLPIGSLCAISPQARKLDETEREAMRDLAQIVRRELLQRETACEARAARESDRRALALSETRFGTIFQQAPTGNAIVDLDGRFLVVNSRLAQITGYADAQLIGMNFRDLTPHEDLVPDLQKVEALLAGQIPSYVLEKRYLRKDGSSYWIELSVALVRDADGAPLHFISVIQDIDSRKQGESLLRGYQAELESRVAERTAELRAEIGRREASESLSRKQEEQLRAILENAQDAYVAVDDAACVVQWNRAAERIFGWTAAEMLGRRSLDLLIPEDTPASALARLTPHNAVFAADAAFGQAYEMRARRRDGAIFPVEIRVSQAPGEKGNVTFAFITDISERKRIEAELVGSRETLQTITDNLPVLIAQVDRNLCYRFNNAMYKRLFDIEPRELLGKPMSSLLSPGLYEQLLPSLQQALAGARVTHDNLNYRGQGDTVWRATYIPDVRGGEVVGFYVMSQDVTDQKRIESMLHSKAMRDALTDLPNRRALMERIEQAVQEACDAAQPFVLYFLDLDGFKTVNDRFGHEAGDSLLQQVADRLAKSVRPDDFLCRLAGDEFVILSHRMNAAADCEALARRIGEVLKQPFDSEHGMLEIGCGIGIAPCLAGCKADAATLLARADAAMYEAKRRGRNGYSFASDAPLAAS